MAKRRRVWQGAPYPRRATYQLIERGERETPARRISHESDPPRIEFLGKPAIDRHRILERGGKRMLRGEPIVEVEHTGARGGADPPGEISQELRRPDRVGAAMEIEDAAIAARRSNRDTNRIDAAAVDRGGERACRRARNKTFDPLEPASNRRDCHRAASATVLDEAQRQSQELTLEADALGRITSQARPRTP